MNTFTKLRDGSWGLRAETAVVLNDVVTVSKKDGSTSEVVPTALVWAGNGVHLYTCSPVTPKAVTKSAPAAAYHGGRGRRGAWRPCGYPGCNPTHCDDCDG